MQSSYLVVLCDPKTNAVRQVATWSTPEWEQSMCLPGTVVYVLYTVSGANYAEADRALIKTISHPWHRYHWAYRMMMQVGVVYSAENLKKMDQGRELSGCYMITKQNANWWEAEAVSVTVAGSMYRLERLGVTREVRVHGASEPRAILGYDEITGIYDIGWVYRHASGIAAFASATAGSHVVGGLYGLGVDSIQLAPGCRSGGGDFVLCTKLEGTGKFEFAELKLCGPNEFRYIKMVEGYFVGKCQKFGYVEDDLDADPDECLDEVVEKLQSGATLSGEVLGCLKPIMGVDQPAPESADVRRKRLLEAHELSSMVGAMGDRIAFTADSGTFQVDPRATFIDDESGGVHFVLKKVEAQGE